MKGRRVMVKEESEVLVIDLFDSELTFFAAFSFCLLLGRDHSLLLLSCTETRTKALFNDVN